MKILNAGDHPLSNADVLDWVKRKRQQHSHEDAQDQAAGLTVAVRPKNFMAILNRTERELTSDRYPYQKNPSVYGGSGKDREGPFQTFALAAEHAIQDHLEREWSERLPQMTADQIEKEFAPVQEMKCLAESELLMIYNHAPACIEMLQPMIENVEERFTPDEQQVLLDVVVKVLRKDESRGPGNGAAG